MADDEKAPKKVTNIDAVSANALVSAQAFSERWLSMPNFTVQCEVMDQRQLRDAMGLRATIDYGDPWPAAEQYLLSVGFRWHWLGNQRVMFLKERDGYRPDTGWDEPEEVE